jgi:hypothetical protein
MSSPKWWWREQTGSPRPRAAPWRPMAAFLVGPDHAGRTAPDPYRDVLTACSALGIQHPTSNVRNDFAASIVGRLRDRVGRPVRLSQLVAGQGQHPRAIQGDVSGTDNDRAFGAQIDRAIGKVGAFVEPPQERRRRHLPPRVFTGNHEPSLARCSNRVDQRLVASHEIRPIEIPTVVHPTEETDRTARRSSRRRGRPT